MERADNALALPPLRNRPLFLDNAPHMVQLSRRENTDARTGRVQQFHLAYRAHSNHIEFLHLYSLFRVFHFHRIKKDRLRDKRG
jgi:hypothetical protein